jgi:hypothetical protein
MIAQKMGMKKMAVLLIVLSGMTRMAVASVLMNYWDNQATATLDDAIAVTRTLPSTGAEIFTTVDMPGANKDNYVDRYTGYIVAPVTGNYTFYIASDNESGFWLSSEPNLPNVVNTTITPPLCMLSAVVAYRDFVNRPIILRMSTKPAGPCLRMVPRKSRPGYYAGSHRRLRQEPER